MELVLFEWILKPKLKLLIENFYIIFYHKMVDLLCAGYLIILLEIVLVQATAGKHFQICSISL